MDKIVLDYTFLKSLLILDNPNHELAEHMTLTFDDRLICYIPYHIFIQVMQLCNEYSKNIQEEVFYTLTNTCRVQNINFKELLKNYSNMYYINDAMTFNECLTIEYMKEKNIKVLLSFNESFDNIKGINRVYDFDKYNKNKLNFFKYAE